MELRNASRMAAWKNISYALEYRTVLGETAASQVVVEQSQCAAADAEHVCNDVRGCEYKRKRSSNSRIGNAGSSR